MAFMMGVLIYFSTATRSRISAFVSFSTPRIGKVQRLSRLMNRLLFSAVLFVAMYSFAPGCYRYIALPTDSLDNPVINATGLFILKLAYVWIVAVAVVTYRQLLIFLSHSRRLVDRDRLPLLEHWFLY